MSATMKEAVFLVNRRAAGDAAAGLQTLICSLSSLCAQLFRTLEPSASGPSRRVEVSAGSSHSRVPSSYYGLQTADARRLLPPFDAAAPFSRVVAVTEGEDQRIFTSVKSRCR